MKDFDVPRANEMKRLSGDAVEANLLMMQHTSSALGIYILLYKFSTEST
ncbi:protein of unknown function [Paenibacillus alvei]|uniref:Uncharacterized protein n=1 Tax=Paenibacillus alvei TaxID=44250 RepID=A0A383RGP3_PAEAL|nr:protein of unknown function [Paenibacillus alvei]